MNKSYINLFERLYQKSKLTEKLKNQTFKGGLYKRKEKSSKKQEKEGNKTDIKSLNEIPYENKGKYTNNIYGKHQKETTSSPVEPKKLNIIRTFAVAKNIRQFYKQNPTYSGKVNRNISFVVPKGNNSADFSEQKNLEQSNDEFSPLKIRKNSEKNNIKSRILIPMTDKEKENNKSNVNINIINSKNSQRRKRSSKYISKVQLVGQEENNKKIKLPINLSTFKQTKSPITKNIRLQNDRSFYNLRKHHSVSQNYDWKIKNNKEKVYEKNDVLHNSKDIKDESKQLRKAATLIQNDYRLFKAIETKNIMILSKKLKPLNHNSYFTKIFINNVLLNKKLKIIGSNVRNFLNNKKLIIKKDDMQYINEHGFYIDKVFLTQNILGLNLFSEIKSNYIQKFAFKKNVNETYFNHYYISKCYILNVEDKLIFLQQRIKSFLLIRNHYYQNTNSYKYIKKENINKLYFFTKKILNESYEIKMLKNLQRFLKARFTILNYDLLSNPNTDEKNLFNDFNTGSKNENLAKIDINEIILTPNRDIEISFIRTTKKPEYKFCLTKTNENANACFIINETKSYPMEFKRDKKIEITKRIKAQKELERETNYKSNMNDDKKLLKSKTKNRLDYVSQKFKGISLSQFVKKNRLPVSPKKGNSAEKIRVNSIIYNDYKINYIKPTKFRHNIILNKALLITKKRKKDNSKEILLIQKFYIYLLNFRKSDVIYLKPNDGINQHDINKEIQTFKSNEIKRNSQKINNKIFSFKFISFITKNNVINVFSKVIYLQKKIKSFLLIKSQKNYYRNLSNYKLIKKKNFNRLYYFTKKISNESNDIKIIKNIQRNFKIRYIKMKQNVLSIQNNNENYLDGNLENNVVKIVLKNIRNIELSFTGLKTKNLKNIQKKVNDSNQIISDEINSNQIHINEIETNQENVEQTNSTKKNLNKNNLDKMDSNFNVNPNQNKTQINTNQNDINQTVSDQLISKNNDEKKTAACFTINETTFYSIIDRNKENIKNSKTEELNVEQLKQKNENESQKNKFNELKNSKKPSLKIKYVNETNKVNKEPQGLTLKQLIKKNKIPINKKKGNYIDKIRVSSIILKNYKNNYYFPLIFKQDMFSNKSLYLTKKRLKDYTKEIIKIQKAYKNYKNKSFKIYRIPIIETYKILGTFVKEKKINLNEENISIDNEEKSHEEQKLEFESSSSISHSSSFSDEEDSEDNGSIVIEEDKYKNRYPEIVGQKIISLYDKNEITNQPHVNMNNYYFMSKFRIKSKIQEIAEDNEFAKIKVSIEEKLNLAKQKKEKKHETDKNLIVLNKIRKNSVSSAKQLLNLNDNRLRDLKEDSKSRSNYDLKKCSLKNLNNCQKKENNNYNNNDKIKKQNEKEQSKEIIFKKKIIKIDYYTKGRHLNFKKEIEKLENKNKIKEIEKNKFYVISQNRICFITKIRRLVFKQNLNKKIGTNKNYKISSENEESLSEQSIQSCINMHHSKVMMKIKNPRRGKNSPDKGKIFVPKKNIYEKKQINDKIVKKQILPINKKVNNNIIKSYASYQNIIHENKINNSLTNIIKEQTGINNRKNYINFLRLIYLFISKNTQEYVYYLFFPKINTYNIKNPNSISKFPSYVMILQRVLYYLQKEVYSCNRNILIFFFEIFQKQNILGNKFKTFHQVIASISKENEDALIHTSLFNKFDEKNQKEMIKFLCDFCKSDKMMHNDKFINERVNQTIFENTNIFTLIKFIDDEYNKLIQGDYCINCFQSIQQCTCNKYRNINETIAKLDSSITLEMSDNFNINEPIIINSFEYDKGGKINSAIKINLGKKI